MQANGSLHCWCREAGKCECTPECTPTFVECTCVEYMLDNLLTDKSKSPSAHICQCVLFPATQGAISYLTNTHDVLRRGAI